MASCAISHSWAVNKPKSFHYILNPLLTNLVLSRWLDSSLFLSCIYMDLDFVSLHKNAKRELGNIKPYCIHA